MKKNILNFVILVIIAVLIFLIIRMFSKNRYEFKTLNFDEYVELKNSNGTNIIFISGGEYTKEEFDNILLKLFGNSKQEMYKLDVSADDNLSNLLSDIDFISYFEKNNRNVVLPVLVIYKDGDIVGIIEYSPEEEIINNLNSLGVSV